MPPLSPGPQQNLLVLEVNDTPDGRLTNNVAAIWAACAPYAQIDYQLQVLYTKRRLIELAQGYYTTQVTFNAFQDASVNLSDILKGYGLMRAQVQVEIERIEAKAQKRRGAVSTPITTTAPITPEEAMLPPASPFSDANDPAYAGSPYAPQETIYNPLGIQP